MQTLNVGTVGYGFMGRIHTHSYKSLPMLFEPLPARIRLVGVAVRNPESQRLAVEQGGYEFATADWQELISRDDIDVINCCAPNSVHKDVLIAAIEAGKHIYCDKPLTGRLSQAEEVISAEKRSCLPRTRMMAHNYRFVPALMRARELMDEGRIGRVFTFCFRYIHSSNVDHAKPMPWKTDRTQGGGVLVDLGSHILDLARWLLGDFERVLAHPFTQIRERPDPVTGQMKPVTGDDATCIIAELKNGALGTLEASKLATGANDELTLEVRGDRGAFTFNLMDPNWLNFYDNTPPDAPLGGNKGFLRIESVQRYPAPAVMPGPKLTVGWPRFHIQSIHEFVRRVVAGEPGSPSFSDALAVERIIDTCYERPGAWAEVPV
ncbi:MAG: Gfo/Idh/MocA family oxidoreductase [Armatimonadetes bacterium]|nr:Gfo/Idh/MocA family oxidoreductase [Armatimonadota bacterium]